MTTSEYQNEKLRRLRDERNLSRQQVGDLLGVTRMAIYLAEEKQISWKLLRRYAAVFSMPLPSLLRDEIIEMPAKKFAPECENDLTTV